MDTVKYSVVIPVYQSEDIVGETIDRTIAFFENNRLAYELLVINDGSRDGSWKVLREKALANRTVVAIDFLRNYGQHNALFCGLQHSTGDFVITMDDDLQNPPEEIIHLIEKVQEGNDVVFGRFQEKMHSPLRRLGSHMVSMLDRQIFNRPKDLVVTNFRIIRRDVVDRICEYRTPHPYLRGLILMFASSPTNVWVGHQQRPVGASSYGLFKLIEFITRILFNYSAFPLHVVSGIGAAIAALSLLLGIFQLGKGVFVGSSVPPWTVIVILLALLNGITIVIVGMLGEYLIRLIQLNASTASYQIREIVRSDTK